MDPIHGVIFFFRLLTKILWREISRVKKTGSPRARPTSHLTATYIPVDYTTTEPNMPAGRVRSTGQHSNRFAKRAAEPNLVTAEPDKAEEPDQQRYDSFIKI